MKNKILQPNIFDYTDHRKYLLDYYHAQKQFKKAFSYRFFAKKAGINSVGLYKDVIESRQNLGRALIYKFSTAIGHSKNEAEYFENMVYFEEAASVDERKLFFERMMACRSSRAKIIDSNKYEYYNTWYYSAVRALITCGNFKDDPEDHKKIGGALNPQIRPDQAKKALKILEKLGFIHKNEVGFFVVADQTISTGSIKSDANVAGLNVVNYQKEMMELARGAFDRCSTEHMNMSTLTLSMTYESLTVIKEELAAIRQKIAHLAERDKNAEDVFQLNIQLFPLSHMKKAAADE